MRTGFKKLDDCYSQIFCHSSQLLHCSDASVTELYRVILTELEHVFTHEQVLMEQSDFPAIQCHLEQHARALRALHRLHPAVMCGDHARARVVGGELLADWLSLHIETQDTALVLWITHTQPSAMAQLNEMQRKQLAHSVQIKKHGGNLRDHAYFPHHSYASSRSAVADPAP